MIYFSHTKPKMLIADEGKVLRDKNDVYIEEHIDEDGNKTEEHIPYKTTTIFLPDNVTEDQAKKMYIEEAKESEAE